MQHMWKGQSAKLLLCVRVCVCACVFKPSAEAYLIGWLAAGGGAEQSLLRLQAPPVQQHHSSTGWAAVKLWTSLCVLHSGAGCISRGD